MASTYTDIGTELMTTGENAGNWGTKTNTNLKILEEAIRGYVAVSIAGGADTTALTYTDGTLGDSARNAIIALTGTITGNQVVTVTAKEKVWIIDNQTSGAYTVQVLVSGQTGVTWATTDKGTKILYCNGTDVVDTGIASNKFSPDSADGEALGSSSKEFSDLYLADSSVIYFGNDQDTTLTHTDGTGLTLNSTNKLLFRDTGLYINSSTDGQLDLVADTEIQIAATTIDINGAIAMDGAITGATNITLSGELDAATLDISGNADIDGTTNLDAVDIDGAVQLDATLTVGADDQGYDVKFFGDTASAYMLWDTSTDDLVLAGAAGIDLAGDIDVDGTANLDAVDIDGAVQIDNTVTVGVNDTGYDVKFFGATSGAYMLWDESTDDLVLAGASKLYLYDAAGGEYLSSSGSALTIASGSAAWELPASDGSANQVLKTDGSGNLDWTSITSATVTALNNATANELVTVGATTTELDAEANLTFDGTDMLIGGAGKLQLRDTAIFINSSTDGQLDIDADTEVEITATTVDVNGILDVSGVIVAGGQISAADGTAGAPSISNTGDLNSGLYFSAADTLAFSAGGTAQFTMADGAIAPVTDNDVDLGTSGLEFKDGYFDGTLYCDQLNLNGTNHTTIEDPTALAIALG